jgi:hypothetical protein
MSRRLRLAPIVVVVAALAAACGSGSSSARSKLVAQADPICKQVATKRLAANKAISAAGTSTEKQLEVLARLAPGVATAEHEAIVRLRTIKAPSSLAHDWQELLAGMQQLADDATHIAADAKAKNEKGVKAFVTKGRAVRQKLVVIDARDGFSYCGRET